MLVKLYNTDFGTVIDTTPDVTELVVSIPKSVYFSATAPSFHLTGLEALMLLRRVDGQ